MAEGAAVTLTKGEINRCGDRLRNWVMDPSTRAEMRPPMEIIEAWQTVEAFRAGFQYPMTKAAVGLRQFVCRESSEVIVAQRLKRMPQIVHKLVRFPDTKLARMEDVGGCRAVLTGGGDEIYGVLRRIKRNWDVKRIRDYIAEPKVTGYRGVHVVIERDDHRVEIQLRTLGQQAWAEAVEKIAGRHKLPLKDGKGPEDLLEYFRLAGQGIAMEEQGLPADEEFQTQFRTMRESVQHFFQRR